MKNDDQTFFEQYSQMPRSRQGLAAAGEWRQLKKLFPPLSGKSVLDLGCGYGWHCRYAPVLAHRRLLYPRIARDKLSGLPGGEAAPYTYADTERPAAMWVHADRC